MLIEGLVGIDFWLAVVLTGAFMIIYIVAGGMLATSWVQIIKAFLLMSAASVTVWVLSRIGWNPLDLFRDARAKSADGEAYLQPGLFLSTPLDTVSLGLGLVLGTAGLPHILMRFFTVPNAKAARGSVMWAGADRRVLRDDDGARLRRARDPRRVARRRPARPATSRCRRWPTSSAASCSSRSSRASRSRRSSRSWRAS